MTKPEKWQDRFDEKFVDEDNNLNEALQEGEVKSFIASLLKQEREKLLGEIEDWLDETTRRGLIAEEFSELLKEKIIKIIRN